MPPPASHMVKPNGWCSRPSVPSAVGRAAELAAPDHQRVVEQAARLQVLEQPGDRLVDAGAAASAGLRLSPLWWSQELLPDAVS